jgi:hypothetical protein
VVSCRASDVAACYKGSISPSPRLSPSFACVGEGSSGPSRKVQKVRASFSPFRFPPPGLDPLAVRTSQNCPNDPVQPEPLAPSFPHHRLPPPLLLLSPYGFQVALASDRPDSGSCRRPSPRAPRPTDGRCQLLTDIDINYLSLINILFILIVIIIIIILLLIIILI